MWLFAIEDLIANAVFSIFMLSYGEEESLFARQKRQNKKSNV